MIPIDMEDTAQQFHIEWWRLAGFRISPKTEIYAGRSQWNVGCSIPGFEFSLLVFEHDSPPLYTAIGEVRDLSITDHHERHAVSEKEAVQWFARVSPKLRDQLAASPLKSLMGDD
jgi:hypothetical protein